MQYYIYSLVCFLLPGTVWLIWNKGMIADKAYKVRHIIWIYIYLFYGYLAVQEAAGIGTIWDLIAYGKLDNSINLIPISSEGAMTYILNIIMFMPLGFLLPLIWKNFRNAKKVVLMGFLMSLAIEICQLIFRNAGTKCVEMKKSEPVIYMFGGILGLFLLYNWRVFN